MSILQPHDRATLLDALRPPAGFTFDAAVATTYSLHLEALLSAPLAFALYDALPDDDDNRDRGLGQLEPIAVLEAVRRHTRRLVVFCQAGQIAVPQARPVLAWLEEVVCEVVAPTDDAVFHPKVWLLRFRRAADDARVLRFLCASRNITFDRSWDTLLRLDSQVLGSEAAAAIDPTPLAEFIEALPDLGLRPVTDRQRAIVAELADEVRHGAFGLPEGCTGGRFWPLGLPGHDQDPLPAATQRSLTISPFVTTGRLRQASGLGRGHLLVARAEELDRLPTGSLEPFQETYVLSPDTDLSVTAEGPEDESNGDTPADPDDPGCSLTGLHAKVTVVDTPNGGVVLTGSANATTAAFERNVEFVTQLDYPDLKIDALFADNPGESASFSRLLATYHPPDVPLARSPEEELADLLDAVRREVAGRTFAATVADGTTTDFLLEFEWTSGTGLMIDTDIDLAMTAWPVTLSSPYAQPLAAAANGRVAFPCSLEALTSFFVIELTGRSASIEETKRFVVNAPLTGAPENRHTRIIAAILREPARFIRYLLLLLGDPADTDTLAGDAMAWFGTTSDGPEGRGDIPVFEVLVRALARRPDRLDHLASVVEELVTTDEGRQVLPAGFEDLWAALWQARQTIDA